MHARLVHVQPLINKTTHEKYKNKTIKIHAEISHNQNVCCQQTDIISLKGRKYKMEFRGKMSAIYLIFIVSVTNISSLVADPLLLFLDQINIRYKDLGTGTSGILVPSSFQNAFAMDFHHGNQKLYVSDTAADKIYAVDLSVNPPTLEIILDEGLELAGGLAVDWINNNLYWTDRGTNTKPLF